MAIPMQSSLAMRTQHTETTGANGDNDIYKQKQRHTDCSRKAPMLHPTAHNDEKRKKFKQPTKC
jgi:hypothetical protein